MLSIITRVNLTIFLILSLNTYSASLKEIVKEDGVIWGFDFLNKNEMIYSIRDGQLYYLNLLTKEKVKLESPVVKVTGQGGLLDVMIDNNDVYVTFSDRDGEHTTTSLAKASFQNKKLAKFKTIFKAKVYGKTGRHFGSRVVRSGDYLFMTIGDRGDREYAQQLNYHNGKILRLNLDGSAPTDNPFVKTKGALKEIWSYGHRNPQGISIHPDSKEIFSCEFGPRGGDELNLIIKGKNYGWPIITYGKEYWGPSIGDTHNPKMEQPLQYWVPSISPSGLNFYQGKKYKGWDGNLFLANLSSKHLRRLVLKNNKVTKQEEHFKDKGERFRQVRQSPDGFLYVSTDSGKVYQIKP